MRVICVKWGTKYGAEWVLRLRSMVARHLSRPHEFVCMTDSPVEGVECVECEPGLPTWWSKVALFKPGKFPGDNLYLDLDVVITSGIDNLAGQFVVGKVVAPDDFSYSLVRPKRCDPVTARLLGGVGTVNSSVMLWRDGDGRKVWDDFDPAIMDELHGDQNWITKALWPDDLQLLPPGFVCSYKYHIQRGEDVKPIVVFHGDPKVTQLGKNDPLRLAWAS